MISNGIASIVIQIILQIPIHIPKHSKAVVKKTQSVLFIFHLTRDYTVVQDNMMILVVLHMVITYLK